MHHQILLSAVSSSHLLVLVHMLVSGRDLAVYCLKCYSHHKNDWDLSNLSAIAGYYCDIQCITVIVYEVCTSP